MIIGKIFFKDMQTSNFARSGSHPKAVAISRSQPHGWTGRVFEPLAPSWRLVQAAKSGAIDEDEYTRRYRAEVLSKLDPATVYADPGDEAFTGMRKLATYLFAKMKSPTRCSSRYIIFYGTALKYSIGGTVA